ncbi:MAG: cytochrome c-type biogenesis protein CcmH [Parvularculaceae bacterium]|nr:cytochrome c-type biogenesis protein CcmH [Parvularculaceae bacterium]
MRRLLISVLSTVSWAALAVQPDERLADPALEARAREISREIRCVVCQSENIDDSNAPLARDLRLLVRERLADGDSNEAVIDYLVARYGDYVLLKPRLKMNTIMLWVAPLFVAAAAAAGALLALRGAKNRNLPAPALTEEERDALKRLD